MKGLFASMTSAVALALTACGGASQPAETPAASGAAGTAASTAPVPAPSSPEPPTTPELAAGIKAFDAGNFGDARASFEAAVKKNPKDWEALYNLGQTCDKLADKACAEASYKAALAANPGLDSAAALLANLYVDSGRLDDALAVAKQGLAAHPGSGPLHEALGLALAANRQQDLATQQFEQAIKISPQDPMFHFTFAHWLNVWRVRGATPHLDTALGLVKSDDVAFFASIGFEYRLAGEFASCIKTFDRAVRIKDGGEVRTERALCKLGLKDDKGAFEDLKAAVATEPTYATGHYYLAGRLAMQKHFNEAAAEYGKYLELAPDGSLAKQAVERRKFAEGAAKKK